MYSNLSKCHDHLENSTAYATLLTPILGYDQVSEIVKEAVASQKTLRQVVLEKGVMTEESFEQAVCLGLASGS